MNSVLNPEAPEFHPFNIIQDGYTCVNKTIKTSNGFPVGNSFELFKTYTDFNVVTTKLSKNVVQTSNQIVESEIPAVKLKCKDNENNTEKIIDVNDRLLDKININIDTLQGTYKPNETFLNGMQVNVSSWNNAPVISKINMGKATFIGAKNIPRPQLNFKDQVDNSNSLWVPKISDKPNNIKPLALNILYNEEGEAVGYEHPYKIELDRYFPPSEFIDNDTTPDTFPSPIHDTKFTYIDTEDKLNELVTHLGEVNEIAVDVEHHSYRTYQGITCLLQITTDNGGDFIIDTLALREHIHKLNLSFTDPKKLKVFHGADSDVVWLQRDFGVYIVGLFDTHQAAKTLNLNGLSLKYLLWRYCQVNTDKKYQLADWRIRPLPEELIEYARLDTHYLLYIWRQMKKELLNLGQGQTNQLIAVFDASKQICGITYNKEVLHDDSHLPLYIKSKKSFNVQQMAALKLLYKWRDLQARELDESTTYLLPNHMLISLAETLPREMQGVNACCNPMPPFVKQNLITIHRMILSCREMAHEPQLYQMPTGVRTMINSTHHPLLNYNVHDMTNISEIGNNINLDLAYPFILEPRNLCQPDLQIVSPNNTKVSSGLNIDAKLFIPPFDRYRKYRSLAQVEEIRRFKIKEAKVAAISKGNELIKEEVIINLQKAQTERETPDVVQSAVKDEVKGNPEEEPLQLEPMDDQTQQKASQRKRKIEENKEKFEQNQSLEETTDKKKDKQKNSTKTSSKNSIYKNINYKKFYSETANDPRLAKMKIKKS